MGNLRLKTEKLENTFCERWARRNLWLSPQELVGFVEALTGAVKAHVRDPKTLEAIAEELPRAAEQWRQRRLQWEG